MTARISCVAMVGVRGVAALGAVAVAATSTTPPSPSATPGTLSIQMSDQGGTLVVADAARQTVAVYRVGEDVRLVGVRNLERDFATDVTKETAKSPVPAADFPGQDPPDFTRPRNAVRTASQYEGVRSVSDREAV